MREISTPGGGAFIRDKAGLWHYTAHRETSDVSAAIRDALIAPQSPAWFWFNGGFAPIFEGDTAEALYGRWKTWHRDGQENPPHLLARLDHLRKDD